MSGRETATWRELVAGYRSQVITARWYSRQLLGSGRRQGWSPSRCKHTHSVLMLCRSLVLSIVLLARNSEQDREWTGPVVLGPIRKAAPR
jgi:hypothetical protein